MRKDVLSWDQYFMGMAHLSAMRSKDPNTRVGACIVNPQKRVVGLGYNGFPYGCEDDEFPWARDGQFLETKYPYVVHAELNAILIVFKICMVVLCMFHYFHVMNAQKPLFKPVLLVLYMKVTSMMVQKEILRVNACFMMRV